MVQWGEVRVADLVERSDDIVIEPPLAYEVDLDDTYAAGDITVTRVTGVKTYIQDQTSPSVDLYFVQSKGPPTALTNAVAIDDTVFEVDSVALITTGDYIGLVAGADSGDRFYFGQVLDVGTPNATSVTVDTPIDFAFPAGESVISTTRDLNVDGSGTRQIFDVRGGGPDSNITLDITRILLEITTDTAPDFTDFGDIDGGLAKGIVLRRFDGDVRNIWNVKTNSDFGNIAYDLQAIESLSPGPLGTNGILVRYTFAGQDKHGVAVRLAPGEFLQLIVQDDLTDLLSFRIVAAGHIVI